MSSRSIQTVTGAIPLDELGPCLVHEHVLVDLESAYNNGDTARQPLPFAWENLGVARRSFVRVTGAGVIEDVDLVVEELSRFHGAGGRTLVDATTLGIRPGPPDTHAQHLAAVSRNSGVNIVLGCGRYVRASQGPDFDSLSTSGIATQMMQEIEDGIGATGVKAGIIGEIGMSQPVDPGEWRALEAACEVQKATGLPMLVHPHYGANSTVAGDVASFIVDRGVEPGRVVLGHMDGHASDSFAQRVLELGFNWAIDGFGLDLYYDHDNFNHNTHDSVRERELVDLCERGYQGQVFLSQDVCTKLQLVKYGGFGYAHILGNVRPSLRHLGVDEETFMSIMEANPRRLFS